LKNFIRVEEIKQAQIQQLFLQVGD
jgi:hypothetical protein